MRADPQTESAVRAALTRWADAYAQRDIGRILTLIAADDDVVAIGTGPDEWRVGIAEFKAQLERDFSQSEALAIAYHEPVIVSAAGPVAWVAGRATARARVDGHDLSFAGRFTAVLEQRDSQWLFVQTHFSVPSAEQAEGSSF